MELELHQDKAEYVIDEWFNQDNNKTLTEITFDILYTYLWFTDKSIEEKPLKADKVRDTI